MSIKKKLFMALVFIFGAIFVLVYFSVPSRQKVIYGVTFSQKFVEELGLDSANDGAGWKKLYIDILDDLRARDLRLIAYWDKVEPEEGKFSAQGRPASGWDFKDLDWQVEEAEKRGAKIILALGKKTPRWPECHQPSWLEAGLAVNPKSEIRNPKQEDFLLRYIEEVVKHYRSNPTIIAWQIENEPFFPFGECGTINAKLLSEEINLVRSLDSRPIMLTDAGELGFAWPYIAAKSDIFGTTLYRYVHNRVLGDIKYSFIPPVYFRLKAWWASKILGRYIMISELQAEPWSRVSLSQTSFEDQAKTMNPEIFKEVIDYAERSGFPKAYFWGVEWWYWMKEKRDKPEMWDNAKALFNTN